MFNNIWNSIKKAFEAKDNPPENNQPSELVTAPLSPEQIATGSLKHPIEPASVLPPMTKLEPAQFVVGVGQSVGKQRDQNQDSVFAFTSILSSNNAQIPFGLFIIADGMGGHQHGEIASETAVRVVSEYILRHLYLPLLSVTQNGPGESLQELMLNSVMEAHQVILRKTPDGGTTLTAALLLGKQLTIAHVGDSRAYRIEADGRMVPLTRDHTLVRRLQEMGQLTAAEASVHPQRSVLYRALGQGEPIEPDIQTHRLPQSGYLILCSDGLWGVVSEDEIARQVMSSDTPHQICQSLVQSANDAGGPDNISVILVQI